MLEYGDARRVGFALAVLCGVTFNSPALANCNVGVTSATCDTNFPNPYTSTIGVGPNTAANFSLTLNPSAQLVTGNANAISLGDNATVVLMDNAVVRNTGSNGTGFYNAGPNTIEFRNNNTFSIGAGASVVAGGTANTSEAFNAVGDGNTILNRGLIQGGPSTAIYFNNDFIGNGRNVVDNFGMIVSGSNGQAIGSSGNQGIVFTNQTGGQIKGNLQFSGGNDDLILNTGSTMTGAFDGGGGTNTLTLGGSGADNLPGAFANFQSLVKDGPGAWTLTGTVSDSGSGGRLAVDVRQGLLTLTGNNSGFNGAITVQPGGTLQAQAQSLPPSIIDNGAVIFDQAADGTYAGSISGSGTVFKTNTGTLTLTSAQTYSGNTTISAGVLQLGNGGTSGGLVGSVINNSTLIFNRSGTFTYGGVVSGTGALVLVAPSMVTFTGDQTYSGTTTVNAGTLQLGNGGASGGVAGNIVNHSSLVFNRNGIFSYGGEISGNGQLTQSGPGTLLLTGNHSYTGGTTVNAGTLQLGNGGTTGGVTGNITNNGILLFNRSDPVTLTSVVSGIGSVNQAGPGSLLLTGSNTYTGGTIISAGTLQLGNGGANGSVAGNVTDNGTLVFNRSDLFTYAGNVSGTGSLEQSGTGTLLLTGNNTYTGGTTINGGILQLGNGGTSGSVVGNIFNNGALVVNRSGQFNINSVVSGTGSLAFSGPSTVVLTSDQLYSGGTTINAGTLQLGNGGTSGSVQGNIVNNGALVVNRRGQYIYDRVISGSGSVTLAGPSDLVLTSDQTYSGGTIINAGTLQLGNGGSSGNVHGDITNNGALIVNRSDALTMGDVISGTGSLTQSGVGTLTLTAVNSYTGTTHVNNGVLSVFSDSNLGSSPAALEFRGGTLQFTSSFVSDRTGKIDTVGIFDTTGGNNVTFSNTLSGLGQLLKRGLGTLTLSGSNSYTGNTVIESGTLQVGVGGSSGSILGNILNNGTLIVNRSNAVNYGGVIGGFGTLVQVGAGVLNLSGLNTYTGLTTVNAGVLAINGLLTGNTQVNSGATLRGTGNSTGDVVIANAGRLAPGNSAGTFNIGSLVLNGSSQLDYELGLPDIVGSGVNDLTIVNGNLTLDGTLNLSNLGGMSPGTYRLFNYTGTLTNNGLDIVGTLPPMFGPANFVVDVGTAGQVNLIVLSGGLPLHYWDGPNTTANNAVDGGSGTWNNAITNWTGAAGAVSTSWQAGFAVLQGAAGTVTLGDDIELDGMQFRTDGYVIEGGGFSLQGDVESIIRVDPLITATINAPIVDGVGGPMRLTSSGAGLLVLNGTNTYTGGTAINGGSVQIGADNNLGAVGGGLSLNNGSLLTSASFNSNRAVDLGVDGGVFVPQSGTTLTLVNSIAGAGMLSKEGGGTLVLTGTNTYSGGSLLGSGVLAISRDANLGDSGGELVFDGGTLRLDADVTLSSTRDVTLNTPGGSIDTNGNTGTFAQTLGGSGGLTKLGAGTLVLSGQNLYNGGTNINAGTLQVGDGGTSGSLLGNIVNNAALVFNRSGHLEYDGVVSGTGSVTLTGPGTVTVSENQLYTGGTTIAAGTLQLGSGGSSGSVQGNIANNGALMFNRSDSFTYDGVVSGSGFLAQSGSGIVVLSADHTYTGGTTINSGGLKLGNGGPTGSILGNIVNNGVLLFDRNDRTTYDGVVSGNGELVQIGPGTLVLTENQSYTGGTLIEAGTLQLGNGGTSGSVIGDILNDSALVFDRSDQFTYDGLIGGSGSVAQEGDGTLVLTGDHAYTGGTTINAGILQLGNGGSSGSVRGNVINNTALVFNHSSLIGYNGVISGPGAVALSGTGTLVLGADQLYTGETSIDKGTLQLGNGGTSGSVLGNIGNDGTLVFNRSDVYRYDGVVSGSGALIQDGAGTLVLSADHTYTGGTTVHTGILQLGNGGASGSVRGDITNNSTLVFNRSDAFTYSGVISGPGGVAQTGTGHLVFTADQNYTGGTLISAGTMQLGDGGNSGKVEGDILNNAKLVFDRSDSLIYSGIIRGSGSVTQSGRGTLVLTGDSSYTGGTEISAGVLQLGDGGFSGIVGGNIINNGALEFNRSGAVLFDGVINGSGSMALTGPGTIIFNTDQKYTGGTKINDGILRLGDGGAGGRVVGDIVNNGAIQFNRSDDVVLDNQISGSGSVNQMGIGSSTFLTQQLYTGDTTVTAGTMRAGAPEVFSSVSTYSVYRGAMLDTAGHPQHLAALTNTGIVSLSGATSGSTLTVTGPYVGNQGSLRLGTSLLDDRVSVSDRLILNGVAARATGRTFVEITDLSGLGAPTTGNGIEVITALNGATTTAQSSQDAFVLDGGHVDAGAFEYRLYPADVDSTGENWYLRSNRKASITYRGDVPLFVALPAQLRQSDLAMLGNLHRRLGDESRPATNLHEDRARVWARAVYADLNIEQPSEIDAQSDGHLSGLQIGVDLLAQENWRAGFYVGNVDGQASVRGNAHGSIGQVGRNSVQSRYVGTYATWQDNSGLYVDSVLQFGNHHYTVRSDSNPNVSDKAHSSTFSLEVGKSFNLGRGWSIEPQAQLIYQETNLEHVELSGAQVHQDADAGWITRLGLRTAVDLSTEVGKLQPYIRLNFYHANSDNNKTTFIGPAGSTSFYSPSGFGSAEVATGATMELTEDLSLYGEVGTLWDVDGEAAIKSPVTGSLGVKMRW